ncbi:hypothetical protein FRB99_005357 [Tulasnella sp. 403]|nr:hypothetical protein FRB99_005357 [Tulasnella sp. 403]
MRDWTQKGFALLEKRRGRPATLSRGPVTKFFILSLEYHGLTWPGCSNSMHLRGPKNDLPTVLDHFGFDPDDPRFEVVTDFEFTYQGRTVRAQHTTRKYILERFSRFISSLADHDKAFIYFAGHGEDNGTTSEVAFLATDAEHKNRAITTQAFEKAIYNSLKSSAALMIVIDACRSGGIIRLPNHERSAGNRSGYVAKNEIMLVAVKGHAFSKRIGGDEVRGVLTLHLLDYIRGQGNVSVEELQAHLERECSQMTQHEPGGPQETVVLVSHSSVKRLALR